MLIWSTWGLLSTDPPSAMDPSIQPPVLITGLPRSGTTWLVHSLNRHPEILVFGETHFFSRRWVAPGPDGTYSPQQVQSMWSNLATCPFWASVPLKEDLGTKGPGWLTRTSRDDVPELIETARTLVGPRPGPADMLGAIGRAFCAREGKSVWIEKTAEEGKCVGETMMRMPDARFIVTMRDPVGFLRSYKYQGSQSGSERRKFFSDRYHPILGALVWRRTYRSLLRLRNQYPDQVSMHVLCNSQNRRAALESACHHLGVPPDPAMYEALDAKVNSSSMGSAERILDREDIAWLRALCTVDDPELTISDDLPKTGSIDLLKSVPSIIRWALRYLLKYRRTKHVPRS